MPTMQTYNGNTRGANYKRPGIFDVLQTIVVCEISACRKFRSS